MSRISSIRSARLARTVAAGALSLVAGGLLVACGGDDSSASGDPTTTAAVSPSPAATSSSRDTSAAPAPAATEGNRSPDEQPQPVPSGFPGPTEVPVSPRGQAFLDALEQEGVTPAADGTIAVATADYICAAQKQGSAPAEVTTFVTAAVGSEAAAAGRELTAEQAADAAQIYIRVAQSEYC